VRLKYLYNKLKITTCHRADAFPSPPHIKCFISTFFLTLTRFYCTTSKIINRGFSQIQIKILIALKILKIITICKELLLNFVFILLLKFLIDHFEKTSSKSYHKYHIRKVIKQHMKYIRKEKVSILVKLYRDFDSSTPVPKVTSQLFPFFF